LFPLSETTFLTRAAPPAARDLGLGQILMAEDLSFMGQPKVEDAGGWGNLSLSARKFIGPGSDRQ
jgi:hypothetical protein